VWHRPNETNAHPHVTDHVGVVHNGIIENFDELRRELAAPGHTFETETDTEVIAHLLTRYLREQKTAERAMERSGCKAPSLSPSSSPAATT
jgi:glucosamine--fructose-6-phosphate aminotransferase (isomerizing)